MKNFVLSLIFVLAFVVDAYAHTDSKISTNVLPEPLPESAGQLIYEEMGCTMCHGHQGGGDGFMSAGLTPKPRNFTDFKVMSRLSDMKMYHSIKDGIPDSAMPAWDLSDEQIFDVISYIKTFLADTQMTIGVCLNEHRQIDVRNLNLDKDYEVGVDRQQFLKVASKGDKILIEPKDINIMRYFKKTRRKLIRTHVRIAGEGQNGDSALIVVRIHDCVK